VRTVVTGRVAPDDRRRDPYLELPFEVPEGATAVEVRYAFDAGSVLDLGLLDPRAGPFPSRAGFRGWSGGARDHVMVTPTRATPGYLPGPLPPGRWHVVLGMAAVAEGGCEYRVEVEVHAGAEPTGVPGLEADVERPADDGPASPGRTGPGWYRADLQSHSHHSDARGSLRDLRSAALERGLDVLAVTDHNTVSHHAPLDAMASERLLWLPGMEVTTYRGHANVWGVDGWVDFRVRGDRDVTTLLEHVHERGGLMSVNHPKRSPGCIGCDWEYPVPDGIDAMEAWQGPWWLRNWESLERYDALLRRGRRLTLVGGSDRHQPAGPDRDPPVLRVGSPTTWLWLEERSRGAALSALRSGRATVSEAPEGPFLTIEVGGTPMGGEAPRDPDALATATVHGARGERLRWLAAEGVVRDVVIDAERFEDAWTPAVRGPFLRAEVVADAGLAARREAFDRLTRGRTLPLGLGVTEPFRAPYRLALSNPVYLR
jgi:hypothetical protein